MIGNLYQLCTTLLVVPAACIPMLLVLHALGDLPPTLPSCVYCRSVPQPLGKQYNPDSAFRDLTRPAVIKNTGVVINPIRYSKPIGKMAHEVASNSNKAKVLTVSGGVMKKPKKAK